MSDISDQDNIEEIDRTLRLQPRVRIQSTTSILLSALVVDGIPSIQFY